MSPVVLVSPRFSLLPLWSCSAKAPVVPVASVAPVVSFIPVIHAAPVVGPCFPFFLCCPFAWALVSSGAHVPRYCPFNPCFFCFPCCSFSDIANRLFTTNSGSAQFKYYSGISRLLQAMARCLELLVAFKR